METEIIVLFFVAALSAVAAAMTASSVRARTSAMDEWKRSADLRRELTALHTAIELRRKEENGLHPVRPR